MKNEMGLRLVGLTGAGLFAVAFLIAPCGPSAAQKRPVTSIEFSAQEKKEEGHKAAPAQRAAPQRAAPQRAAPQRAAPQRAAPQRAVQQRTAPRRTATQKSTPRIAIQRRTPSRATSAPKTTARAVTRARTATQSKLNSRKVTQQKSKRKSGRQNTAGRTATAPAKAVRVVTPRGTIAVTASRLRSAPARGAGRTVIRGHNYSVWRSGYHVRYGGGWRTFVALSALSAIMIGSDQYYPYAYVTAPEDYCQGLTQDGCELNWERVQTEEGDVIDQCVAYCPWQQ